MEPLMAYCPGAETKSTLSKPFFESISTILSWDISSPSAIFNMDSLMDFTAGTCSSRASG